MVKKILSVAGQKGFTLVELLVAATIIGMLVIFATTSYRNGVAETRWAEAKANADRLAAAVQRLNLDYSWVQFSNTPVTNVVSSECPLRFGAQHLSSYNPQVLINCDYLENGPWDSEYFQYYICHNRTSAPYKTYSSEKTVTCVQVRRGASLPSHYKSYTYCYYASLGGKENP